MRKKITNQGSKNRFLILVLVISMLSLTVQSQNCTILNGPTDYNLNYSSTNAVSVTNVNQSESVPGVGEVYVKNYTFTIPFFETNFTSTAFLFSNSVGIPQCGVVNSPQNSVASFCPSTIEVYNSFNSGTLIASNQNMAQISLGSITQAVSIKLYRVVGKCNGNIYRTSYFRIIVQKEPIPTFNLVISAQCQLNSQGQTTGWFDFRANGTMPTIPNLYLRTSIPSSSTCSTSDIPVNIFSNTSTITNFAFFSCNTIGTYTVKMIYKRPKVGGGFYNTEVPSGYGWSNFTWTKGFNTCAPQFPIEPERKYSGLDENEITSVIISPNPSKGIFKLTGQFNANENTTIEVFDMMSKKVFDYEVVQNEANEIELNLSNLETGSYILLINNGGERITKTIVKE